MGTTATWVLLAVIDRTGDRLTVRQIRERIGLRSTSPVHRHLVRLYEHGLVDWDERRAATIRATCRVVATGAMLDEVGRSIAEADET